MNYASRVEQEIEEFVRVKLESEELRKREQELERRKLESRLSFEELREQEFEELDRELEKDGLEFNRGYAFQDVDIIFSDICKPETNSNGRISLREMRLDRGLTEKKLAEMASMYMLHKKRTISSLDIIDFENSHQPSYEKANAIADVFDVDVEDLFPDCFYCTRQELKRRCCPKTFRENEDLRIDLENVLETLALRQIEVIRRRYEIGSKKSTLKEIGENYGHDKQWAEQIQEKSLKRLRHPSRSRILINYLEV